MNNLRILVQATIKTIKYFPLVFPATIVGLAVLAVGEREV